MDKKVLEVLFGRYVIDDDLKKKLVLLGYVFGNPVTEVTVLMQRAENKEKVENSDDFSKVTHLDTHNRDSYLGYSVTEEIHYDCIICKENPCVAWNKKGQPVCKSCADSLKANNEVVRYE